MQRGENVGKGGIESKQFFCDLLCVCGRCNECWPISRLFSRTMRSFRANEGLGGGWSGEPRGKGLVHGSPVARSRGNSTESWAKAKGSAAAGDSGGTHAAAPIVLRF